MISKNFDNLGLMDSVTELYVTKGSVQSHNLTFQEFFAAIYISKTSFKMQLEQFSTQTRGYKSEGRLKVVSRFLAGLT